MRFGPLCVVLALATLTLVGCAPISSAEEQADESTSEWKQFHSEFPDVPKPDTAVVRIVDRDEWAATIAECLNEAGYPDVTADPDGGLGYETPLEQASQFGLAKYVCVAQYPVDPKYSAPPTDEMVGKLYDYLTKVQTPCLEAEGFDIPAAPSKTRFVETFADGPEWMPYMAIPPETYTDGNLEKLKESCPEGPPPGSEYYPY